MRYVKFIFPVLLGATFFGNLDAFCAENNGFKPVLSSYVVSPTHTIPGGYIYCSFSFTNQGTLPAAAEEKVFLHFTDVQDRAKIRWQFDHESPVPTPYWMQGQSIQDGPFPVQVPDTIPEGKYGVRVGLWNPSTNLRSLDVILPVTVTIHQRVMSSTPSLGLSVSQEDVQRRYKSMTLRRFLTGTILLLENDALQVQIKPQEGLFCVQQKQTGRIWQSAPHANGLGYVMGETDNRHFRVSLKDLSLESQSPRRCRLSKVQGDQTLLTMQFELEKNTPVLRVSWKPGKDHSIHRVDWNSLLWTTNGLGGGAVIPRLIGQYFAADSDIPLQKRFKTYGGWGHLHIPLAGIIRDQDAAFLSWTNPSTAVQFSSLKDILSDRLGTRKVSLSLHCTEPSRQFRLHFVNGNSYVDIAQAYRKSAEKEGMLIGMQRKAKRNREVQKLFGAAEFKPFVFMRRLSNQNGKQQERLVHEYTEEDCIELARHLHDDLGLEKVLLVLAGWIHRGYDNQHPDILPAAPEIGGNEGVHRISDTVRSYGYLFGLHDNYQDMYRDAPSWDSTMLMKDRRGRPQKGGVWAGGQAWLIASNFGLELAKHNLPAVKKLFSPNAYFIDTTYAAPLYESFDPNHPLSRQDDLKYKSELSRYAARMFGVHGSETGYAWGVPYSHYFEGILSGHKLIQNFPDPGAVEIPLFPLVFHDCVAMYTHQGDRTGMGDARSILRLLVLGEMPLYKIPPHQYWRQPVEEPDVSNPDFCFARSQGGGGVSRHPIDRFIKNTYAFLSPFSEQVRTLPMTGHEYLKPDRSVERSTFGDHCEVVVNYGPEDYLYGKTLLPPMGFVAVGDQFLAQHYYPNMKSNGTKLIVIHRDQTYIGWQ